MWPWTFYSYCLDLCFFLWERCGGIININTHECSSLMITLHQYWLERKPGVWEMNPEGHQVHRQKRRCLPRVRRQEKGAKKGNNKLHQSFPVLCRTDLICLQVGGSKEDISWSCWAKKADSFISHDLWRQFLNPGQIFFLRTCVLEPIPSCLL